MVGSCHLLQSNSVNTNYTRKAGQDYRKTLGQWLWFGDGECIHPLQPRWSGLPVYHRSRKTFHLSLTCVASPLWMRECWFSAPDTVNDFSQVPHLCGFSPLWMRRCFFRLWGWLNDFSQVPHLCGFPPLWIRRCVFRFWGRLNDFSGPTLVWLFPIMHEKMLL